jgi:hypothetical protein
MPYVYYNPNPEHKYTIDCVIRAISKLMDTDWDTTSIRLSAQAFMDKSVLVDDKVWGQYLRNNGYRIMPLPNTCPNCYTVRDFANDHPHGRYLLKTYEHVIAVVDGDYYDTGDSGDEVPIYYYERSVDHINA